jgi:3-mercaptopyruvate sulfurtransferase SseA
MRKHRLALCLFFLCVFLVKSSAFAYTYVTVDEAKVMTTVGLKHAVLAMQLTVHIRASADLVVLDVRTAGEFCGTGGHIPGAVNYPFSLGSVANYDELPKTTDILVY